MCCFSKALHFCSCLSVLLLKAAIVSAVNEREGQQRVRYRHDTCPLSCVECTCGIGLLWHCWNHPTHSRSLLTKNGNALCGDRVCPSVRDVVRNTPCVGHARNSEKGVLYKENCLRRACRVKVSSDTDAVCLNECSPARAVHSYGCILTSLG